MNNPRYVVLIPCAGTGTRFSYNFPKQYSKILDKTILEYTLTAFLDCEYIDEIAIVVNHADQYIGEILNKINNVKIKKLDVGGKVRAETVLNGLNQLALNEFDWVLVHDAARCCITTEMVNKQINILKNDAVGGILAIPVTDTIKYVDNQIIQQTLIRQKVFLAQTPQMFRFGILKSALALAKCLNLVTDESSAVEAMNYAVKIVEGSINNIKVTYQEDLDRVKCILKDSKHGGVNLGIR